MEEIRPTELESFIAEHHPFLLDVREEWEFEERRIPGSVNIPIGQVTRRLHEIPRERVIVAICERGKRSLKAGDYLIQQGYERFVILAGGTLEWEGGK